MKKTIRSAMRTKNLSITSELREKCANELFSAIESSEEFKKADVVALYSSLADELPTDSVIERWGRDKRILLPRVGENYNMEFYPYNPSAVERGAYGIAEPQGVDAVEAKDIDLMIIPGVAFTRTGARLGRGKGYYDRYLSRVGRRAYTIGVCYLHQIVDSLPTEPHDITMDEVIATL